MNGVRDSKKTAPHRAGALSGRPAERAHRRHAEKQRHVLLGLFCVGLGAVAGTSLDPSVALATVRQAFQQARDSYAHAVSLLQAKASAPRRPAPVHPLHAESRPPFGAALSGPRRVASVAFVGYGPIVLASAALPERPQQRWEAPPQNPPSPDTSVPPSEGHEWIEIADPSAPPVWTVPRTQGAPLPKVEMAAFEMSATRRTLDAAYMLKSAESDVWTMPLDAYDAFEAALRNEPFASSHPRRPLVPESPERFALGQEDEDPRSSGMQPAAAADGSGTERVDPAVGPAPEEGNARDTATPDAKSAAGAVRVEPRDTAPAYADTFASSEAPLATRPETARNDSHMQAADQAAVEGIGERPLLTEADTPVSGRPEAERPAMEPADNPQPDSERPESTRPDTETPAPEVPETDRTEIARPDIESTDIGVADADRPGVDLSGVASPDIGRPDNARPDTATPDVIRPDSERPDMATPDAARPDTARPEIESPGIELPELDRPELERPVLARPDNERPDIEQVDIARPDIALPEAPRPDIERPDLEHPDLERPAVERPELERPELERPELERPELERPELERPAVERPGIELPLIERPNS